MKKSSYLTFITAFLLCMTLISAFAGCSQGNRETITIYPCYFNRDVEDVDCTTIRATLEQAGWELRSTDRNEEEHYNIYHYMLTNPTSGQSKVLSINEHVSTEAAAKHYDQMWANNSLVAGFAISRHFFESYLRISDCSIMSLGNAHVDLLELLGLGTVQPLEISLDNSYEMCKEAEGVDIDAVKAAMEADGYKFYETVFVSSDEEITSYVIISPEQDRTYAFVRGSSPKSTYKEYKRLGRVADFADARVGIHFVGFADGSCILSYGDSFEEIKEYFVQ